MRNDNLVYVKSQRGCGCLGCLFWLAFWPFLPIIILYRLATGR